MGSVRARGSGPGADPGPAPRAWSLRSEGAPRSARCTPSAPALRCSWRLPPWGDEGRPCPCPPFYLHGFGERQPLFDSDSKLFVTTLAVTIARRWPDVLSNAVDPGWVPTRMGGRGAPDDLRLGHLTQEWLATSNDADARTSGGYWYHQERIEPHPAVRYQRFQDQLLDALARFTGTRLG